MRNVWRVFTRDLRRLVAVPQAWIIILGIIVTPALYAWVNVIAFWDPYSNTSHIDVAVVNQDTGAHSDLAGDLDVGSQVVAQLKENNQLGWRFTDLDDAMERVHRGDSYAAIVIPPDFSQNLLSITTANFTRPQLQYFVNEKANAVAPKMTDVGATTLDRRITDTFTSTVAEKAAEAIRAAGTDTETQLGEARDSTIAALDDATAKVGGAADSVTSLKTALEGTHQTIATAQQSLVDADQALADTQQAMSTGQTLAASAQSSLTTFTQSAASSYVQGATLLAGVSTQAQSSLKTLGGAVTEVNGHVGTALDAVDQAVTANGQAISDLQQVLDNAQLDPQVADRLAVVLHQLQDHNTADQQVVTNLQTLNTDLDSSVNSIGTAATAIDSSIQDAATASGQMQMLLTQTIPSLNAGMSAVSASAGGLSTAITSLRTQLAQAQQLLTDLDGQVTSTVSALGGLSDTLGGVEQGISTIRTDVVALSSAAAWKDLGTLTGLDPEQIAQFMASPVQVSEQVLFPVAAYGSGMAALFTNLSLWIGSFMLVVVLKLEVDREGVQHLTVRQGYMARWLLLACLATLQGLLVTVGNLVIGVQHVNAVAFVATGMLIAPAYLSIIYALSVSFSHIGKGLCIVLVIMQIPGASGLYPIEMMPGFFRRLYPFFPFTYGIDAMREVISGFYDAHYWKCLGILGIFIALAFLLGLVLRRSLGNVTRMFNRRIADTGLLVAEEVHLPGTYPLPQVLRALANREEFSTSVHRRAHAFRRRYPRLLRGALVAGIAVPLVLLAVPSHDPSVKALLLGLWVAWFLIMFAFLVATEYVRESVHDGLALSAMDEVDLRRAVVAGYRPAESTSGNGAGSAPGGRRIDEGDATRPPAGSHEAEDVSTTERRPEESGVSGADDAGGSTPQDGTEARTASTQAQGQPPKKPADGDGGRPRQEAEEREAAGGTGGADVAPAPGGPESGAQGSRKRDGDSEPMQEGGPA